MCGIAGVLDLRGEAVPQRELEAMADSNAARMRSTHSSSLTDSSGSSSRSQYRLGGSTRSDARIRCPAGSIRTPSNSVESEKRFWNVKYSKSASGETRAGSPASRSALTSDPNSSRPSASA